MFQDPVFSVSGASTLQPENSGKVEIFQYSGQKWDVAEQNAETLVEQEIWKPSIIFASSMIFKNRELMAKLCRQFDIPDILWTRASRKASGYFGCYDSFDDVGNVTSYNLWLRFIIKTVAGRDHRLPIPYHWEKIKVFTKFVASKSDIMLCFDMPPHFRRALKEAVTRHYSNFEMQDPFSMPTILISEVVSLFDASLWSLRDIVRGVERTRAFVERPQPDYYHFHEISRHVIHSTETLSIAVKTLESMIEQHKAYLQDTPPCTGKARATGRRVQQSLFFQKSLAQCLEGRSEALGYRLQNEINLAFNTVSQYDSQTAVKVGQAAQADSASMRAISVLTFVFFPGTFISSILGMDFFNFSPGDNGTPQRWAVSNKLWIFFALTIPLTFITGISWFFWQRRSDRRLNGEGGNTV